MADEQWRGERWQELEGASSQISRCSASAPAASLTLRRGLAWGWGARPGRLPAGPDRVPWYTTVDTVVVLCTRRHAARVVVPLVCECYGRNGRAAQ